MSKSFFALPGVPGWFISGEVKNFEFLRLPGGSIWQKLPGIPVEWKYFAERDVPEGAKITVAEVFKPEEKMAVQAITFHFSES